MEKKQEITKAYLEENSEKILRIKDILNSKNEINMDFLELIEKISDDRPTYLKVICNESLKKMKKEESAIHVKKIKLSEISKYLEREDCTMNKIKDNITMTGMKKGNFGFEDIIIGIEYVMNSNGLNVKEFRPNIRKILSHFNVEFKVSRNNKPYKQLSGNLNDYYDKIEDFDEIYIQRISF